MVRPLIGLLLAAPIFSGCAMCAAPDYGDYSAYGGTWDREDRAGGRVGSVLNPAGTRRLAESAAKAPTMAPLDTNQEEMDSADGNSPDTNQEEMDSADGNSPDNGRVVDPMTEETAKKSPADGVPPATTLEPENDPADSEKSDATAENDLDTANPETD